MKHLKECRFMDYDYETGESCFRTVFRLFVCMSLTLILGLHAYPYLWTPSHSGLDSDFTDIKYIVTQLTRGLSEINRKHERLETEIQKLSVSVPAALAAAGRAKDVLEPAVRRNNRQALDIHQYDRQVVDYALQSAGGRVLDTGDTVEHLIYESPVSWMLHALVSLLSRGSVGAEAVIQPGSLPGECWAFKGPKGEVVIRLLDTVHVTGVSLEHIPAQISPSREISAAPRLFSLEGLEHRGDQRPHDFGTFEYNKEGTPIQYFEVVIPTAKSYNLVRLRVLTNWGNAVYTCVYRVRVHGDLKRKLRNAEDGDMLIDIE